MQRKSHRGQQVARLAVLIVAAACQNQANPTGADAATDSVVVAGSGGAPSGSGGAAGAGAGHGGHGGQGGVSPGSGGGGGVGSGGRGGGGGWGGSGGSAGGGGGGAAGAVGSGGNGGQSGLPAGVAALFPPPDGQGICPDPQLRISFSAPPSLGTAGKIQVVDEAGSAVATVDMAQQTVTDTIGGTTFNLQRPVFVDGAAVVVSLKNRALGYGQTYHVRVEKGAIRPPSGGALEISGTSVWRFTTRPAVATNPSTLRVHPEGAGDFCSVQGAIDAIPAGNSAPVLVAISDATYHEVIHFRGKNNVTLKGQSRKRTVIEGTNNNNLNGSTATRSLVGIDSVSGLAIETMTIHNLTPQGGSQAEALRLQGCDKCTVEDVDLLSLQDTVLWSGRIYARNCTIAGNVDYIWGTGVAYFESCEIHTVGRPGANVQARNSASSYGYVFVDSKLTADAGVTGDILARIDVSAYPASHVAYIDCQMGNHVAPAGWTVTGAGATSELRFWEYHSTDASGRLLDISKRLPVATQLSAEQAARMRDPTNVLGGWSPPRQ